MAPSFKKPTFGGPTIKRPPLPSLAPAKDPLKAVPDNIADIEQAAEVELDALSQGFRDRAKAEAQRFQDATDTGYYTCVVFANRAQNDAFLAAIGKLGKGDMFIDGRDLAAMMGIELPAAAVAGGKPGKVDGAFAKLAGFLKGGK